MDVFLIAAVCLLNVTVHGGRSCRGEARNAEAGQVEREGDGLTVGFRVARNDGEYVGRVDGDFVGRIEGGIVGRVDGDLVGRFVGRFDRVFVGAVEGEEDRLAVGLQVGAVFFLDEGAAEDRREGPRVPVEGI